MELKQILDRKDVPSDVKQTLKDLFTERKRSEKTLQESERMFRQLAINFPDVIYRASLSPKTPTLKLNYVSPAVHSVTGYAPEEFYNDPELAWKVVHPDDRLSAQAALKSPDSRPKPVIERWIRKDGIEIWVEVRSIRTRDENGNFIEVQGIVRDITERKKSERKSKEFSKQLELILDNVPALIFYKDTNNNFIQVNKVIADAHQHFTKEELAGKNLFDLYPHDQAQAYWDDDLRVIKSGKPELNIEEPWDTAEGRRWVNTNKIPLKDEKGDIIGVLGFSVDITERKKVEQKLKNYSEQLEEIVEQRTHDLRERVKELTCLYGLSKLLEDPLRSLEEVFHEVLTLIPLAWQYPDITCVRIIFEDRIVTTDNFKETPWKLFASINVSGKKVGTLEVYHLEKKPEIFEGQFLKEERDLIDTITRELNEYLVRKHTEEALQQQRDWLEVTLSSIGDAVIVTDTNAKITFINPVAEKLTGWTAHEALSRQIEEVFNIINEQTRQPAKNPVGRVLEEGIVFGLTNHTVLISRDGREIPLADSGAPISDKRGIMQGVVIVFRDITNKKRMEETIRLERDQFERAIESLAHPFYVIDAFNYQIMIMNSFTKRIYSENAEINTCYALTHGASEPCPSKGFACPLETVKRTKSPTSVEHQHRDNEGNLRTFELHCHPIFDNEGNVSQVIEYSNDITDRITNEENLRKYSKELEETIDKLREAQKQLVDIKELKKIEEDLRKSLGEKDVLLQEIHHRVKNNLQMISSLLSLQSEYIEDEQTLEILKKSQTRIKSIALIHEKFYSESEDLARIDIASYVHDLTTKLFYLYGISLESVKLNIDIKNIWLDITLAIPFGMIINELLSNSLRHAFPDNRGGEINILLRKKTENKFILIVGDNGVGLPLDIDFPNIETLGLQLVYTLVNQLEGTIELDRSDGTVFKIQFLKAN